MNEEVMRVLKMLEEGKIDSQKAGELIEVLNATKKIVPVTANNADKILKIKVNSSTGDNVNVNIPVKFIKTLGSAIKRIPKVEGVEGIEDIDIQAILQAVGEGLDGKIVDVKSEKGDIVEIVVE
ncbi:SHOCT-like domain-containing protein [Clostridium estertheticum]|uniref:YvlB/LiaX N-terminal domain-containing protein n=1 Tax=Clostridium estertheticum TaxID=238834 RepID=A0A5N7IIJ1_9CLOT|nr:hypothetical protein [Clostridium estertheticum]MBU3074869.1 hypothetical protein [Clostridium estertheticum]MBU3165084.1 hypothetical protein [Clostridium estertheticum]MBW9154129.1 hypothetical protein [Clostridium estertheticum]MCB2354669.1 hypothetical protein [Clostridium estertheticum]MCB2361611.1 hypothetical protein [Clostridium estertheticum]